jgi:hypothetical protein
MNLAEFKSELRSSIKRGNSFDDRLGGFARRAARWIEQNYTLQYMRRRIIVNAVASKDVVLLPTNVPIKSVEYLRFDAADGTRHECSKGLLSDPEVDWTVNARYTDWPNRQAMWPSHFYMDGMEALVFNRVFPEALDGQGMMARYSDFPMKDTQTHWLLKNAEGLMLRQALIEFLTDARDDRGAAAAMQKREEDIKALLNADFEAQYTGQDIQLGG